MINQNKFKWNVDTNQVEELPVEINKGDEVTVCAEVSPTVAPNPNPISWSMSQSPASGIAGDKCIIQTGDDIYKGTFTFKAIGQGSGSIKYEVMSGVNKGKTKTIQLKVI